MRAAIENQSAIEAALGELHALLGERVTAAQVVREHHSHGESTHAPGMPDLVCFPQSTEEVSGIVKVSARHGLPVVPFGAGTSLEGQVNALRGGICVDMRQMNRVLRVSVEDMDATVEAGIGRLATAEGAGEHGADVFYRSGGGRDDRRDGVDAGLGDDGGALRDDAGERAGADRGAGRWAGDPYRDAGAEIERRI